MLKLLLTPLSGLYKAVVMFRHKLFDWGIIKSKEYKIPIICVGNLTVGGTGKTPMCELLITELQKTYNIAVISRGYKRKTKGYLELTTDLSYKKTGDEPKQIKLKFPNIIVAVCEKRTKGIDKIMETHPEVNLIILDDGFQHRYVEPWLNILLMDYNRPVYNDKFLPVGRLRDSVSQLYRADVIIVTKTPDIISAVDQRIIQKNLELYPYQKLFYSQIKTDKLTAIFPESTPREINQNTKVIALAGIANASGFIKYLGKTHTVIESLIFDDHHNYNKRDIIALTKKIDTSDDNTIIITTEKDAVKLMENTAIGKKLQQALYYSPIKVEITQNQQEELTNHILRHVRKNQKYSIIH